jgi:predicted Zn-dependent protease
MALAVARRWNEAGPEFRRAIELNANNAAAHYFYAIAFLMPQGQVSHALEEFQTALSLDPLSAIVNTNYACALMEDRRYVEALAQFQKVLERDPNFPPAHYKMSQLYGTMGRLPEAVHELQKGLPKPISASPDAKGYTELTMVEIEGTDRSAAVAVALAISGDRDQAFHYLEKAYADGDDELLWAIRYPALDPLRTDPRYADLMQRLGLPR